MNRNLEDKIEENNVPVFKSEGECRIAYFLENNLIRYQYESAILINSDKNRPRIWYPDFYLPEFKTYIEYYGLAGNHNYDTGIKRKESVYSKMGLDVIPVYSWMFNGNWQKYIMKELKRTTSRPYRNLMTKRYWLKQKHSPYKPTRSFQQGYHRRLNNHY